MCSTLIPYFAEPDDIRHPNTTTSATTSVSSAAAWRPSTQTVAGESAAAVAPHSQPQPSHVHKRQISSGNEAPPAVQPHPATTIGTVTTMTQPSADEPAVASAPRMTSAASSSTGVGGVGGAAKSAALRTKRFDRHRTEGGPDDTSAFGNHSLTRHGHKQTPPHQQSSPSGSSSASNSPSGYGGTPSALFHAEDPVVARLLRR